MKEMIYDDSRWVQRLYAMNCWSEGEARQAAEKDEEKTVEIGRGSPKSTSSGLDSNVSRGLKAPTVTLGNVSTNGSSFPTNASPNGALQELNDGFVAVAITPEKHQVRSKSQDPLSRLEVFKHIRSMRGQARQEYAKIHEALSSLYFDAVRCQNPTQAMVFRTYRDPNHQAVMLSNLERFAKGDLGVGRTQREARLDAMVEAFETAVTREFEQAVDLADVGVKMPKYARVLVSLNGGKRAVETFIDKNPLINSTHQFGNPLDCLNSTGSGNYDPRRSYEFFAQVSSTFNEQVSIIDQVFPASVNVVITLVQRIGKQMITEYVTAILDEAHRMSVEIYLKASSSICEQALTCAKSLRPALGSGNDFYEAIDQVMLDIFESHADLYLAEELSHFQKRSDTAVSEWERQLSEQDENMQSMFMSNVNRQVDKRDFLSSFKKVVMMPVNVVSTPFAGKSATAKALVNSENLSTPEVPASSGVSRSSSPGIANGVNLSTNRPASPLPEPPTTELAAKTAIMTSRLEGIRSLFSIEVALSLVHMAKASIERAVVFLNLGGNFAKDTRLQCELVFVALLQTLGTRHIQSGFDQAISHLSEYKPREVKQHSSSGVEPLVTFLELVNVGDLIQQMLDVFYEQELVATKLTAKDDFLNRAVKEKKRFEQMLDSRVASGLNKGIEVLMDEIEYICATTQKPEDFNPDGDASGSRDFKKGAADEITDIGPTETARKIVHIVDRHTKMLVGSTDKNTLDVFNQEVGMRLFAALCKHLKRQRISTTGSIKLIRYV